MVSYRLRVRVAVPKYRAARGRGAGAAAPRRRGQGQTRRFFRRGPLVEATLYERDRLDIGATIAGPAIVEQFDATTVIPPGWTARRRLRATLVLARA